MPTTFELHVWAEGQAFDADGTPLDQHGNRIESSEDDTTTTEEDSE